MPDRGVRPLAITPSHHLERIQTEDGRRRAARAKWTWDEATSPRGTPAEVYLRGRGITAPLPGTLRFPAACSQPIGQRLPALVALIEGVERFAVCRTYLRPDGSGKADVVPAKAILGSVAGGAVRLVEAPGGAGALLVVAEGIKTALSLASGLF
jgi:hypothetical protein